MAKRTGLRRQDRRRRRTVWLWLGVLVVGAFGCWMYFQSPDSGWNFRRLLEGEQTGLEAKQVRRGSIYDRNYKELAVSLERVSVYVRTREVEGILDVAEKLAPVLETEEEQLLEALQEGKQRIWLMVDISQDQEDTIRELDLPGVYLHKDYSRFYPQKTDAAHLLGFAEDGIGLAGIEFYFDRLLREVLAEGDEYLGHHGQELLLTLDMKIQSLLEDLVREISKGRPKTAIGAYAMDAGTGSIVAAAQFPSYNPNTYRLYSQDILESLLVRPMVVPETFRLMLRDVAVLKSQYDARGSILPWSISQSGQSLGTELRLWESLGLESSPPEEFVIVTEVLSKGGYRNILNRSVANLGTVPEMMTPLNLLTGLSVLLNGGQKIQPHVAGSVVDTRTGKEHTIDDYVDNGTGQEVVATDVSKEFSLLFGSLSAKDDLGGGTVYDEVRFVREADKGWELSRNGVYFIALPLPNAEVTMLLTIQDNGGEMQRSKNTQAVSPGKALASVLPRIAVLQQVGKGLHAVAEPNDGQSGNFPATLDPIRDALRDSMAAEDSAETTVEYMPDLIGFSLRKGLRMLQDKNCRIRVYGTGQIIGQEPKPGTELNETSECVLKLRQEDVSLESYEKKIVN
ncbi:PASTA domain-containing protein [Desulfopila sp. IMCC35008]|uniref:PASTA domain-containing protein n=1 Tax=Desulfopila sp. IMCC35008 TaxID=2653858 RepID=UPI0013D7394D|nr:PASTA domain-containing protein [Desulfopila sp. IMCC35008]